MANLAGHGISMTQSTITSKGRTTLPAHIRPALHLKTGGEIPGEIRGDSVVIHPQRGAMPVFAPTG
jgi:bifunctional DNA-binding transcriptional regulator/antitoxin component of YhaV-PrlF toxin-antitoxin module